MRTRGSKMQSTVYVLLSLALLTVMTTTPAIGQTSMESGTLGRAGELEPSGYGLDDRTITVVSASTCLPAYDQASGLNVEYESNLQGWVYKTGGTVNFHDFVCPVSLPTGARLEIVALEACDDNSPGSITLTLSRCAAGSDAACSALGSVTTGTSATPGCNFFFITGLSTTVNNFASRYNLFVTDTHNTSQTKFRSVELWWRRQISPAPGTATFGDVPTSHLFFQQIEALAASGITSGCGGGNFCPNSPLTRGQMAAFLAKALGLHWPN
ncbi:MAG: S-layer homology domain-containing protein [Thermoanaerobaculia bacterium]